MAKSNKKNKKKSSTSYNKAKKQEQEVEVIENSETVATGEEVIVEDNTASQEEVKQTKQDKAVEEKQAKQEKSKDKEKDKKKKKANANPEKKTAGQKTRALFSELKKVTWPTFGEACKQTGIVLLIVLIFSAVLLGINLLLGWLFGLIVG